jgi:hypothetical protein
MERGMVELPERKAIPQIDPKFTQEQWELLWNLLYNATTNNAHMNRETGLIELDAERDDGAQVLDPYPLEDILQFDAMQRAVWIALGRDPEK